MNNIEAVIFDWAGTTVDYGSFAPVQAFIEGFKKFGITPTLEEVRQPMGMLKWDHIKTMMEMPRIQQEWLNIYGQGWENKDVDKVYRASEAAIMKILHQFAEPKPFVLETVQQLRSKGIKIGSTTGYTREMMDIVAPKAESAGYKPDYCVTPSECENKGRPYPYMIFENLRQLSVSSVKAAIKVGDTVADIKEGKNAGLTTIGVIEGSSVMGLTEEEYEALSAEEKEEQRERVKRIYMEAGADYVIQDIRGILTC
ncbi:MAG: phosphonoacetaldehyde hydrolase [Muricomes sp.]